MSTGYGWEGLRQVCATLLGARHVPERLCSGLVCLGHYNRCSRLPFCLFLRIVRECESAREATENIPLYS